MTIRYTGLIAPEETPTGDGRLFAAGRGKTRPLPITVMAKFESGGHINAVIVGKLVRTFAGPGGMWGSIDLLDPAMVPEVNKVAYMLNEKVMGPSVDLDRDFTVEAVAHPLRVGQKVARFTDYNIVGVTLVPMPAFAEVHLSVDNQAEQQALLASAGVLADFDINARAWDAWPIAPREYTFNADEAVKRIADWSGIGTKTPSLDHYASAFLWRDGNQAGPTMAQDSFRLPLADIIDGQPHLIYHAVYAAAALLSGGHGGLPNIAPEEQERMKGVINAIYDKMAKAFGDSGMKSPFNGGGRPDSQASLSDDCGCEGEEFAEKSEPYGDVIYADPGYRDNQKRYPVDTPEHVRAAWSYINVAKNAAEYTAKQLAHIKAAIKAAARRHGIDINDNSNEASLLASVAPLAPPKEWFDDPHLPGPTRLTIGPDGRVFGHVAQWRQCHVGIGDRCVIAPKSRTGYAYFKLGPVVTADGSTVECGKITMGAGHAHAQWGIIPSRDHYDNSAACAAVVNVGEDKHGIWVAGALTAGMTPEKVAELRRSPLSGDWRMVNGNLELIAALAVNNPGFVVRDEGGSTFSMFGVGVVEEDEPEGADRDLMAIQSWDAHERAEPDPEFDARLAAIKTRREALAAKKKADRLREIDDKQARLQESKESSIVARQFNAKFNVIKE
jgi:hypothetical protein